LKLIQTTEAELSALKTAAFGEGYKAEGDGKEVRLHTDKTTQITGNIQQGDRIVAKVNDQNHALTIDALAPRK
jgi:hypothetical protein